MYNFDFIIDRKKLRHKENTILYKRKYRKRISKFVKVNPNNGRSIDCVEMIYRNKDRFNYGLSLNEE